MNDNQFDLAEELLSLERALASPDVRASKEKMAALLADDFVEFGGSGRRFTKESILSLLEGEPDGDTYDIEDFDVRYVGADAALVTYTIPPRTVAGEEQPGSLRSSLWVKREGGWKIAFHQGTRF